MAAVIVVVTVVGKNTGLHPQVAMMKQSTNCFGNYSTI